MLKFIGIASICILVVIFPVNGQLQQETGKYWTRATDTASTNGRDNHSSVVFDGRIWLIGGNSDMTSRNDVWSSSDGTNWTQATASAPWTARSAHTSVVFDNQIWVIGGEYWQGVKSDYQNDVWCSSDGINWTQATAAAPWSARSSQTSVVFDGKIWVMGGVGSNQSLTNDVWYSSDEIDWTQATASAQWSGRENHTSVVFDDKIWALGGYDGAHKRDVWYSGDFVVHDFNGDLHSDLLWHNRDNGQNAIWLMSGATMTSGEISHREVRGNGARHRSNGAKR